MNKKATWSGRPHIAPATDPLTADPANKINRKVEQDK